MKTYLGIRPIPMMRETAYFRIRMNTKYRIPFSVVALAAMLFIPASGSAQSVLLTASEFAILGGTAATVGGPGPNPIVNGHVGLAPAATSNITGFPPAVVSGNTLSGAAATVVATGGATSQARLDLITAKNALYAMPSNVTLSNVDLGTLAPLNSGVYTFGGAASQTGALVLDAQGQNAVSWVFNIATSLTTAVNSTVTFINLGSNGGTDLGLYWNVGTAVNIGDNNTILGNYLAGTSISFTGITATLGGTGARALALAGVTFAGPGTLNPLGGPGGGDWDGGLMYDGSGNLVPIPPVVVPPVVVPPVVVPPIVVVPPLVVPPVVLPPGTVEPPVLPPGPTTGSVLLSSTGAYTPGASGIILIPGTPYNTSSMTVDGIGRSGSAPASLTITTATVALSGLNTYTGGTFVDGAVFIVSSANLPANQSVALNNGSSMFFNQTVNGAFGGAITGTGTVTKLGAGALTLLGANTYAGGTFINNGALIASTSTLPANKNITVIGTGVLIFDQTANGTFGGSITGGGIIQKRGTGAVTLALATTSPVDLRAGSLYFTSGLGATTVTAGATLGGSGTITGNLVNHGTVSPGISPGTITVSGNYTQSATGKLVIELASATSFDQLVISGTATLAGGLQVDVIGGYVPVGQSFPVLTAAGGVTGTFGTLSGTALNTGSASVMAAVIYSPNAVTVAFTQLPFAGFALTPNQVAVANAAQAVPALTTALNVVPSAGQMPAALNALSPQGYEIWSDIAFAHTTALAGRMTRDDGAVDGRDHFYVDGSQRRGRARGDLDVRTSTFTSTAVLVGGDHLVNRNLSIGALLERSKSVADLGSPGSRTTVKGNTVGVRASWNKDRMFAHAVAGYGFEDYSSTRPVVFPGTSAMAGSETEGREWFAGATVGKHLTVGSMTVSPFAGVLASHWKTDGFTETGAGVFNATVADQSARSLRTQIGLAASLNLQFGSVQVQPHVRAAWLHEFNNDARAIRAAFGSVNYAVTTRKPQRDSALLSAGLDLVLSPNTLLYADVSTQTGGITKILSEYRVGLAIRF